MIHRWVKSFQGKEIILCWSCRNFRHVSPLNWWERGGMRCKVEEVRISLPLGLSALGEVTERFAQWPEGLGVLPRGVGVTAIRDGSSSSAGYTSFFNQPVCPHPCTPGVFLKSLCSQPQTGQNLFLQIRTWRYVILTENKSDYLFSFYPPLVYFLNV